MAGAVAAVAAGAAPGAAAAAVSVAAPGRASAPPPPPPVYCVCRQPYDVNRFMIECDICKDWFHGRNTARPGQMSSSPSTGPGRENHFNDSVHFGV